MFRFGLLSKGRSFPIRSKLLLALRPTIFGEDVTLDDLYGNFGEDVVVEWRGRYGEDVPIVAYMIPEGMQTEMFAILGDGLWFDSAGTAKQVNCIELAQSPEINQWAVWYRLDYAAGLGNREVLFYDPATLLEADVAKIAAWFKEPGATSYPSAFFNGLDFRLATYTGGLTYVPDHLGVLRSPGANRWAVQGMRLATTVADGAVLGAELVVNGGAIDSASWIKIGISNLVANFYTDPFEVLSGDKITQPAPLVQGYCRQDFSFSAGKTGKVEMYLYAPSSSTATKIRVTTNNSIAWNTGISRVYTLTSTWTKIVFYDVLINSGTTCRLVIGNINVDGTLDSEITAGDYSVWGVSAKEVIPTYINTDESGNPIIPSTPQKTVTYNTDWTAKTFAGTFDKFDISDPLKAPGWLCEPVRTNYALNSATPATHTTGTLAVGTYTLWQEGTGSIVATAGTAAGTFGTASNGTPATITINTAGTVVLTASGTNTFVQLEIGAFKTSRIYTTTAPVTRAATIASFPTAGKIPANDFAIRMIVVPRATGQTGVYLFGAYVDASNYTTIIIDPTALTIRKRISGVNTDATVSLTHGIEVPIDLVLSMSTVGMQLSVRTFSTTWAAFTDGTLNSTEAAKANAPIGTTYQLGALNGASQFTGNISLFDCVPIPTGTTDPMAWAKAHWGIV